MSSVVLVEFEQVDLSVIIRQGSSLRRFRP